MGLLSTIEQRSFSSNIKTDLFHFSRTHNDISYSYWFKSYISNYFGIKFKGVYRYRDTLSDSQYVQELKSFEKFEIWLSVILKMDLNVY